MADIPAPENERQARALARAGGRARAGLERGRRVRRADHRSHSWWQRSARATSRSWADCRAPFHPHESWHQLCRNCAHTPVAVRAFRTVAEAVGFETAATLGEAVRR